MEISKNDVYNAMSANDTARVADILEEFELFKEPVNTPFSMSQRELAQFVLSIASVMAWRDSLAEDLAEEILERTAITVDIFNFSLPFLAAADIGRARHNFYAIPKDVFAAMADDNYSDAVANTIENMSREAFEAMLVGLVEKDGYDVRFNLPIFRFICGSDIIPQHLVFSLMASSMRTAHDEFMPRLPFLDALFGLGRYEADDEDNDDDQDDAESQLDAEDQRNVEEQHDAESRDDTACEASDASPPKGCGGCHDGCCGCCGCFGD